MEQEYKWDADPGIQNRVRTWAREKGTADIRLLQMEAQYFDTPEGELAKKKIALRLRKENDACICCMKLRGAESVNGLHAHEEYECPAATLEEGLAALPDAGAPAEVCGWLQSLKLQETCRISFLRYAMEVQRNDTRAELALDQGKMTANGKAAPLCEIELEYKKGALETFQKMGRELAETFQLRPQLRSKLARAREL